jgi:hypothetical protein
MTSDPTAQAAFRVPRSEVDGLYVRGEPGPATRVDVGTVVSIDGGNRCTVVTNDEEVAGVLWLGLVAPREGDVVEIEQRGDLLCIPAINDLGAFLEATASDVAHIVSDADPGAPPAQVLQIGGSMQGLDAWAFYSPETANWLRELGGSGQGMRCYQTGQPSFVARNMATIPSGEAGVGPNDAGFSWTGLDTQAGTYNGLATVETSTEQAFTGVIALKATWVADPKASMITLRIGGHSIGAQYTARVFVYVPAGSPDVRLGVQGVTGSASLAVKNTWTAITVTYTATAAEHIIGLATPAATASTPGTVYFDAFSVVAGPSPLAPYFDGSTPSTATEQYLWNGTEHLSTSEHWTGPTVPSILLGTNAVTNPSLETATTGWAGVRAALTRVASATSRSGGYVAHLVNDGTANTHYLNTATAQRQPVTPGQVVTFSMYARLVSGSGLGYYARVFFYDSGGAAVGSSVIGPSVDLTTEWQRIAVTATIPAGAVTTAPTVSSPNAANTDVWEADAALFQSGSVLNDFFDGDSLDVPGHNYQWTGTAHASTSTWRTLPVGNPPGTTATLWSEEVFDVAPGQTIGFDAALLELANAPTAQLVVSYGADDATFPLPGDPATATATMGAAVPVVGPDVIITRTTLVPDTVTFPGPGTVEPKTARLGIKLTGNATGTAQCLILKTAATLTPKGWPVGSQWMDPDAHTGGLVTIGETAAAGTTGTLTSTTTATPIPFAKKAIVTAPESSGGIAVVTFSGAVQIKTATSTCFLRLVGPGGVLIANTWISAGTDAGNFPFMIRGSVQLAAGEEVTVTPTYLYSGSLVTVPHVVQRMVTMVEFYPGAVRSAASSDPLLRYWDGDAWRPDLLRGAVIDLSVDASTAAPVKTATTTTCTRAPSTLHAGETLTLTSDTTAGATGTVTFSKAPSPTGPWASLGTATISAGKATKTWEATAGTWYFKAAYGGSSLHLGSTSAATAAATVTKLVSRTLTIPCSWVQAYQGNGAKLTGTAADAAVQQGWASATHGNRRSLLRFDTTGVPAGAEVTNVSLVCKGGGWHYWSNSGSPVLVVGSFNNTPTVPATYTSADKFPDRSRHNILTITGIGGGGGGFTVNISSWAKPSVMNLAFSGILIGPGPSDSSTWWGYSAEPGKDQFTLKVTYDNWE